MPGEPQSTASPRRDARAGAGRIGFVSPTGPGSLGDQAMLDAASAHAIASGYRACVFPHAPDLRSGAKVIHYPGKAGTLASTAQGILTASHLVYIGADVLDGVYHPPSTLKRLRTLAMGHRLGKRTRVMGSSWSETPAPEVIDFLTANPWLEVLARDPVSQTRMERDIGRPVRLVADLAFLLEPQAKSPAAKAAVAWADAERRGGATVLAVNLSGHTVRTLPGRSVAPFAGLVSRWLSADLSRRVVVLPHDRRAGMGGDLTVCADLAEALSDFGPRVHAPDGEIQAWDAKAIAGACDIVLTGRMHLAIAALGQGVPPVSIVYQGKFEGLMAHFGLEQAGLTLAPDAVDGADEALAAATDRRRALSAQIVAALPRIKELSRANFEAF